MNWIEFKDLPPLMKWVVYAWCVIVGQFIAVLLWRYL